MNRQVMQKRPEVKTMGGLLTKTAAKGIKPAGAAKGSSAQNIDQRETLTNGDPPRLMLWGSDE